MRIKSTWEIKVERVKNSYPNLGKYTILVLASGRSLNSINNSVMAEMGDMEPMSFEEAREAYCEEEVDCWSY